MRNWFRPVKDRLLFVFVAACLIAGISSAAQAAELKLPAGLKKIEEQAFFGDTSLDVLTIQEGTETIGSKAFANSSVKVANFPASLYYIADDAFDGCEGMTVNAQEETYAYTWAVKNKFIKIPEVQPGETTVVIAPADWGIPKLADGKTGRHSRFLRIQF